MCGACSTELNPPHHTPFPYELNAPAVALCHRLEGRPAQRIGPHCSDNLRSSFPRPQQTAWYLVRGWQTGRDLQQTISPFIILLTFGPWHVIPANGFVNWYRGLLNVWCGWSADGAKIDRKVHFYDRFDIVGKIAVFRQRNHLPIWFTGFGGQVILWLVGWLGRLKVGC